MNLEEKNLKSYIFVRTDISPQQIAVQSSHAILLMAQHYSINPEKHPSIIVIGIKSKEKLITALNFVEKSGIDAYSFFEPLFDDEMTAFATIPLDMDQQIKLKKFQLIRSSSFCGGKDDTIK